MVINWFYLYLCFIALLFIISFFVSLFLVMKFVDSKKNSLLTYVAEQLPKDEKIVHVMTLHPFLKTCLALMMSIGFCSFISAIVCFFACKEDFYISFIFLLIFFICPFAVYIAKKSDILLITENAIFPVKESDKNFVSQINEPIYFYQINKINVSFSVQGCYTYISLKNGNTISILGLHYSKKIRAYIEKKIKN